MTDAIVATASTNSVTGSVVNVTVDELVCVLSVEKNHYSDTLPIIPSSARVDNGKILYQFRLKAGLIQHSDGKMVCNRELNIKSNRLNDKIIAPKFTDVEGKIIFLVETYEPGNIEFFVSTPGITSSGLKITLKEAWYESEFLIAGYYVCNEEDFSGALADGSGLHE